MPTYSFLDFQASITGPGGSFPLSLGPGVGGVAEEGISIEFGEDKDRILFGADGTAMHSLNAAKGGRVLIRLQKTSPVNQKLAALYNYQTVSSLLHGKNVIVLANPVIGDIYQCRSVAFLKFPANHYAKEAGIVEWDFNAGYIDPVLGAGIVAGVLINVAGAAGPAIGAALGF
jgi:hypothetical protein